MGATEIQAGRKDGSASQPRRCEERLSCYAIVAIGFVDIFKDLLSVEMRRCYELLRQTSRSFAAVIQALDDDLRFIPFIFLCKATQVLSLSCTH